MFRRIVFIVFLIVLGITLYFNPNFKTISAGVAVLLFGMVMLEEGFRTFTKGPLSNLLKKATKSIIKSISTGAFVTALIQSSSLVSVITISFVSAGIISLSEGLGLVFGANIGTTATAWLVAGLGLKVKISGDTNRYFRRRIQASDTCHIRREVTILSHNIVVNPKLFG